MANNLVHVRGKCMCISVAYSYTIYCPIANILSLLILIQIICFSQTSVMFFLAVVHDKTGCDQARRKDEHIVKKSPDKVSRTL